MNSIRHAQNEVEDFHAATGQTVGDYPAIRDADLRARLIAEECVETLCALGYDTTLYLEGSYNPPFIAQGVGERDLVKVADGIADAIYVLLGTAVACGIDMEPVWNEVHRTNMAKVGGPKRADGKAQKPDGWKPPDILRILKMQSVGAHDLPGSIWQEKNPEPRPYSHPDGDPDDGMQPEDAGLCGVEVALYGVAYGDLYDPCTLPKGHDGGHDPSAERRALAEAVQADADYWGLG